MNQAVEFGLLLAGGVFVTQALTGTKLGDITKGKPGSISATGQQLSIGGVGQSIAGAIAGPGGYVDPFGQARSVHPGRIDEGQDFSGLAPGSPILAPGDSKFLGMVPGWYRGQPYAAYQLLSGPHAGRNYYLAEQITNINQSPTIKAGTPIAYYAASGTGIEMGWAGQSNPLKTLAQETTGYREGQQTAAGQDFHQFLHEIGAA